jgi:hypothetical protein
MYVLLISGYVLACRRPASLSTDSTSRNRSVLHL